MRENVFTLYLECVTKATENSVVFIIYSIRFRIFFFQFNKITMKSLKILKENVLKQQGI